MSLTKSGEAQPFPAEVPFLHELGVEFLGMGEGRSQIALELQPRHMNSWAVAHGGITMTLLDVAMAIAGRSLEANTRGGVTVEMKTSFLQPAGKPGDRVIAKGHVYHRSTTLYFCEGEVWNGERLVAKASGTFKFLRQAKSAKQD